ERAAAVAGALVAAGAHSDPIAAARELLGRMGEGEKVATLSAHPRIGERGERMSPNSRAEQSGLGADHDSVLQTLNEEYERRFGFRFVVFVDGRQLAELEAEMRSR